MWNLPLLPITVLRSRRAATSFAAGSPPESARITCPSHPEATAAGHASVTGTLLPPLTATGAGEIGAEATGPGSDAVGWPPVAMASALGGGAAGAPRSTDSQSAA